MRLHPDVMSGKIPSHDSTPPSYSALQEILQGMAASGRQNSFEKLLALLIGHLTGETVIVSKAGTQLGDGLNDKATIAVQAKRYQESTSLPLNEIAGEIQEIMDQAPYLEVYVLGATKSAQDIPRFQRIEQTTGISVVVVDWASSESPVLGQICAVCWEAIRHLTPFEVLNEQDWTNWAQEEASKPGAIKTAETIRREILEEPKLQSYVALLSAGELQKKFHPSDAERPSALRFNQIDLYQSVRREAEELLQRWWSEGSSSHVAMVKSQEGMGKSWVTAAFAQRIANSSENSVFWLDSREWASCRDLKSIIERIFRYLVDERALSRVASKALRKWRKPILIVLDGVSERDALVAAKDILFDFTKLSAKQDQTLTHIRILLTSRERAADELQNDSTNVKIIPIGPYTDNELGLILPKLSPGLSISDIPEPLLAKVARIPRYLPTCLRILPELGALQHVTVEIVLWHDLLLRLRGDQQMRRQLGMESTEDAESILIQLARNCSLEGSLATSELTKFFESDFVAIRQDLLELRWLVEARKGHPTARINPDHLRLGWALYLRETLREGDDTPSAMEDRLQRALEPMGEEDHRIAALRLCGRLSLTDTSRFGDHVEKKREALLRLWVKSRNITHVNEELFFWHDRDEAFYLSFVENLLPELPHTDARQRLTLPLIKAWKEQTSGHLIERLSSWVLMLSAPPERWQKLEWPVTLNDAEVIIGGHHFPLVQKNLLVLSGVAISIISHRSENRMLRPLALAAATDNFSSDFIPPRPEVIARGKEGDWISWCPNKQLFDLCAAMMRWTYGEGVLSALQTLVDENPKDELLKCGVQWLAAFLKLQSVPTQLALPSGCSYHPPAKSGPVEKLLNRQPLLAHNSDDDLELVIDRLSYEDSFGVLACWEEVEWTETDKVALQSVASRLLVRKPSRNLRGNELLFAWLARWEPKMAAAYSAKALRGFRFSENDLLPDDFVTYVVPHPDERQAVLSALRLTLENAPGNDVRTASSWPGKFLALTLIADEWQEWIEWLEDSPSARIPFEFYPVPQVLEYRLPSGVVLWLQQRLLRLEFNAESLSQYGCGTFFAYLASSRSVPNTELFEKIKLWLKTNQDGPAWRKMFWLWCSVAPDFPSLFRDTEQISLSSRFKHYVQTKWSRAIANGEVFAADTPYEKLLCFVPWDELGRFLLHHQRMEDFRRWGGDLIEAVKGYLDHPDRTPLPHGALLRRLNASDRVESLGPLSATISSVTYVSASSAWLAEKRELKAADFIQTDQRQNIDELHERVLTWREWFEQKGLDAGHQARQWLYFSASSEVMEWAALHPDEFEAKAVPFLMSEKYFGTGRMSPDDNILAGVGTAYLDAWFCLSPGNAEKHYRRSDSRYFTETAYGLTASFKLIWHPRIITNPKHEQRPFQILMNARNDLEIARLALAAQESNAASFILSLAQEWAGSKHMRERALAVSILAWIESSDALTLLQELESRDTSQWVRSHAKWAVRVWKTEDYAKKLFQRISRETEPWLASIMLQQLQPALTFAAKWWMARDLKPLLADSAISSDIRALLFSAHYRHRSIRKSSEKIWDRDLERYWRGDRIESCCESLAPLLELPE